jgi:outer membrane lipoprotein-sorting protein
MENKIVLKKRNIFTCLLFACVCFGLFAADVDMDDAKKVLKLVESNTAFYETDFSGEYTIVQDKPGEGKSITEAKLFRRDKTLQWTILITGPASEKGKGYLQADGNIWFYDPTDHRFTYSKAKDKFQNTNAKTSDFTPQFYDRDYSIESVTSVKLGKLDCYLYDLKAKVNDVDYPELKIWVSKNDGLLRMKEDYSLSGQKLRTTAIPSYQVINQSGKTYSIPVKMLIQDNLRGKKIGDTVQYEKTQVTIANVKFEKVEDTVYTKPYLEMGAAR